MARAKKSYGFDQPELVEPHFIDVETATLTDPRTGKKITYVASSLGENSGLTRPMTSAFCRLRDGLHGAAGKGKWIHLRRFVAFLEDEVGVTSIEQVDREKMERYRLFLRGLANKGDIKGRTPHAAFMFAQSVSLEALRVRNAAFRPIQNPFPGVGRVSQAKAHLSSKSLKMVLRAAKNEIAETWSAFSEHQASDQESWSQAEAYVASLGSVMPLRASKNAKLYRLYKHDPRYGSIEALARRFHATRDALIPYLILIGYWTAANMESLATMRRDCMQEGVVPGTFEIRWEKLRSAKTDQAVVRTDAGRFSAPTLIRQVLALTQPLVSRVPTSDCEYLFLCSGTGIEGGYARISPGQWGRGLGRFIERNELSEEDGRILKFTFDMMRPSALAETYRRTGDLMAVKRFANHRHLETTVRYVLDRATDEMHDAAIATTQKKLHESIDGTAVGQTPSADTSAASAAWSASGACKDTHDGPIRAGRECPAWIWPFNDPGLVIPDEGKYVAEIVRLSRALEDAKPRMMAEKFARLYGSLHASVLDALGRFSSERLNEAEEIANGLGPLPELGNE